jgi:hypothetical protein
MVLGAVLHAPGAPIEHVHFPLNGMVSLLTVMKTGEQIETAIVGREGVVGAAIGSDGLRSAQASSAVGTLDTGAARVHLASLT